MKTGSEATRQALDDQDQVYILEDQIGHILRKAHQRATKIFQDHMEKSKLTPTQFATLIKIRDLGSASQNRLGRLTAMDPSTIMGVVKRLHGRNLIRSTIDPLDRRRTRWLLTSKGLTLVEEWEKVGFEVSEKTLSPLSAEEKTRLIKYLHKIS